MKISYNWLKQFISTDKTPQEISLILTNIGLEVESVDKIQSIPGGLEGLKIGYVKSCSQHPNADRLKVTQVDLGTGVDLQIVCGASNVAEGQKVVVAPVNTTVYPVSGEPFKITKSKIRGEISEGMICAEDEIGLGNDHEGIMVLDADARVGEHAAEYFEIEDDYVFEIGLTPNRADAASHLGVARDLAAYLKIEINTPANSEFGNGSQALNIPVSVEDATACPRYSSLTISGVKIGDSPNWLKEKLNAIGVRPINNVVDITNYILHDLGQPLHAFDADKIRGGKVLVKTCPDGTRFQTLDEVERTLTSSDLMICDAEGPMCIAGVFGGLGSGVGEGTRNVFLESALFNPVSVRKTSKRFGLKTDASFRFERGTDPEMTVIALTKAAKLIVEIAGGQVSSEISDIYPDPIPANEVIIKYANVNRLIGKIIDQSEIATILTGLGIRILEQDESGLRLSVPSFKVDVTREVDIIEEILRIHGYDNVEIPAQIRASVNTGTKPDKESVQDQIANMLSSNGFFEILTNSLTSSKYLESPENGVSILNPLSSDLDVMRQDLLFTSLESVSYNMNRKAADLKFYEFGKVYKQVQGAYIENHRLAILMSGDMYPMHWTAKASTITFQNLKSVVDMILSRLNIHGLRVNESVDGPFAEGLSYLKGDKVLVNFGKLSAKVLKKADVESTIFFADFDWDLIIRSIKNNKVVYKEVSKFPSVKRDLSMLVDNNVSFDQLRQIAFKTDKSLLKEVDIFDVYTGDKLPAGKKSYALSFVLQDEEKTLADKQIDAVMQKLIYNFEKQTGAEIRR